MARSKVEDGRTPLRVIAIRMAALAGLVFVACSAGRETAQERSRYGGPEAADSLFYHIERTPCFGRCPAYTIDLYRSGYAVYEGRSNVELSGRHTTRFGPRTLEEILEEAERIGLFTMQDKYDAQVTDLPTTHLHVVSGDRDKTILARYHVPATLKAFTIHVDSLLLQADWRIEER